ncbi:MAG TPA: multicopper oxidase domain-containing protein [Gemmatimonadales bacterium]|nr:multicopper oxidase domain-containing protein [Gemmatimonadales bacterium]
MRSPQASVVLALLLAAACTSRPTARAAKREEPWTSTPIPANVSHGEAPVGTSTAPAPVDPRAPEPAASRVQRVRFEVREARLAIAPGVVYEAWTFDGRSPGPVLRVTVGDTMDFTLVNHGMMPHSIDFHAAQIAPSRVYRNVMPGDSIEFRWVPQVAGAFLYHCGTAPVAMHIANGMYGALIVDPARPLPPAREFVFVQGEWYTRPAADAAGALQLDWNKLLSGAPDQVTFNGVAAQYADHPISVKAGELLRLYVVDAGPNRISAFHVVGAIFSKVYPDAIAAHAWEGVQTATVPPGGGMIFETRLAEPGTYPFVTHAFADATNGAVGMFEAQ